jgi:hypothetical protein
MYFRRIETKGSSRYISAIQLLTAGILLVALGFVKDQTDHPNWGTFLARHPIKRNSRTL